MRRVGQLRNRRRVVVSFGAATAMCLAVSPALAATDATLAQANELSRQGHPKDAYVLLSPLTDARAADPEFDYVLGLAALDSGHMAEAILAFQRALAIRPGFAQARAEIARAYAMTGDIDTARKQFDTVAGDPTIPDPVRHRFGALVRGFDKVNQPGLTVSGYAEAGGGYDSNVNAATSLSQLTIPLLAFLGPATLSNNAKSQGDGFGLADGGVTVDYGFDRHSHVFASGLGSGHFNLQQTAFSQALGVGTLGYAYTASNHDVMSLAGQYQQFWLDGTGYRRAAGGIAQYSHVMGPSRSLSLAGQYFDVSYPTDRLRDARRYSGSLVYVDHTILLSVQGGSEDAKSPTTRNLSNTFYGGRFAVDHALTSRLSAFANATVELRDYRAPDTLFLIDRRDRQYDVAGGLRYRLTPSLIATAQAGYTRNNSNIALDQYNRVTGSVSVRVEF